MDNTCFAKNVFESSFDSFDMVDGFLNKIDLDLKKNDINEKLNVLKDKPRDVQKDKEKKMLEKKTQYYDSPIIIEDSDDSDFFDLCSKKKKKSLKADVGCDDGRDKELWNDGFINYLSPIHGRSALKSMNLSSSTPERQYGQSSSKGKNKQKELDKSDFVFLEGDVFEDWEVDDSEKDKTEKETVTLSQALELIKEAELKEEPAEEPLNRSIDLLTGEVVGADVGVMFEESFNLPKSVEKNEKKECSDYLNLGEVRTVDKPPAAQKLNFEFEKICEKKKNNSEYLEDFCFSSDDDFDFFTQDLIKKIKKVTDHGKSDSSAPVVVKSSSASSVRDLDLNESSDGNVNFDKKRRKCLKVIESDTTEDSPSPKFLRQNNIKKTKKRRNLQENFGREFIELEAEVSDIVDVSSEETEQDGEYDESFVDESAYLTQNSAANMTARYLESVKAVDRPGTFKIPAAKPYNPANVFSQIPEESNSDYEFDSFCVKDVEEEEPRTDLSDLEIAEKILEMDRKKKRRKRSQKLRKLN